MSLLVLTASCDVIVFFEIITKSQKHIESNNRNMNSTMLLMSIQHSKAFSKYLANKFKVDNSNTRKESTYSFPS